MRGWSSSIEQPLKKPPLDIVEVVSDLVDLTAASDNEDSDDGGKKEKKAKKALKKREKERKREELRKEQAAKVKALRDERLQREVEAEARRKADEAALRAAARREGYDRGIVRGGPTPVETVDSPQKLPPPPEPAAEPQRKRPRGAEGKEAVRSPAEPVAAPAGRRAREPSPLPGAAAAAAAPAPPALAPAPAPAREPAATGGPKAAEALEGGGRQHPAPAAPPAPEGRPAKAAPAGRKGGPAPSMAEVIAAARKEQSVGATGFASFEGFDAQASHEKAHGVETEEFDPEDEEDEENPEGLLPAELYGLQDLPEELLLADMGSEPGLYVAHYVRYVLGAWQRMLATGDSFDGSGLTRQTAALFRSSEKFQSTAEALKPLLRQLRSRKINEEMLSGLETVVKLAAEREYNHANSVYVGLTMGRKTWHNSLPCFQQQQNHGGSVRKIIKQSELMDFDWDPVVQAYMYALKRVIQFAQCIRPPDDPAKCA